MDLTLPLLIASPCTARELALRGARMDLRHAAGLGRMDVLKELLQAQPTSELLVGSRAFACIRGEFEAVRALIDLGARCDILGTPVVRTPRSAFHEAANR